MLKKGIALLLALTMAFGGSFTAFAGEENQNPAIELQTESVSDISVQDEEADDKSIVSDVGISDSQDEESSEELTEEENKENSADGAISLSDNDGKETVSSENETEDADPAAENVQEIVPSENGTEENVSSENGTEEAESPENDAEEAESPENDAEEAESPENDAEEAESPENDVEKAESPDNDTEETASSENNTEEAVSQDNDAEEAESPADDIEETVSSDNTAEKTTVPEEADENDISGEADAEKTEDKEKSESQDVVIEGSDITVNYIFESQTEDGTFVFVSAGDEGQSLEKASVVYSQNGSEKTAACETKENIAELNIQGEYSLISMSGTLEGKEFTVSLKELDAQEPVVLEETDENEETSDEVNVLSGEYASQVVQGTFDSEDAVAAALEAGSSAAAQASDTGEDLNSDETASDEETSDDVQVASAQKIIVIDPGHGRNSYGAWSGCCYTYNGVTINEDVLVMKIAQYLKTILEGYGIKVYLTRTDENALGLEERVAYAASVKADALVSIHLNANTESSAHGLMAMTAKIGTYHKTNAQNSQTLATDILNELLKVGFSQNYGLYIREIDDGRTYEDGSVADYYGICRYGQIYNVPSAIIEHGFLSNESDYTTYLNTDEKLKKLAQADAKGILKYLGISSTSAAVSTTTAAATTTTARQTTTASTTSAGTSKTELKNATTSENKLVSASNTGNGWRVINSKIYYYVNNKPLKGHQIIGGKKYFFDNDTGVQLVGWHNYLGMMLYFNPDKNGAASIGVTLIKGHYYFFDNNGVRMTGWITSGGNTYYCNPDNYGIMVKGIVTIDGSKYRFNSKGVQCFGFYTTSKGNTYYFNKNKGGKAVTGIVTIGGKKYGFGDSGVQKFGFATISGKTYYFDPKTGVMATGTQKINGSKYRFGKNGVRIVGFYTTSSGKTYYYSKKTGKMVTGIVTIDGAKYWFRKSGVQKTGYYKKSGKIYYFDPKNNGKMAVGAVKIGKKAYLFNSKGVKVTGTGTPVVNGKKYFLKKGVLVKGWFKLSNWKLYADPTTYVVATGTKKIGTKVYLFDNNGILVTGKKIVTVNGKKYRFNKKGILQSGWYTTGSGKKMYFDPKTYAAATGFKKIGSNTYCFSSKGYMYKGGLKTINKKKYYFSSSGVQKFGWLTVNSHKMYFNKNNKGAAQTGLLRINKKAYYFDENGYLTDTKNISDDSTDSSLVVVDQKTGRSFEVEPQYLTDPQIGVDITEEEFFIAAVYAEAGVLDETGQIATAMTMLNRVENENYGSTIELVIYQKTHFEVARNGSLTKYLNAIKNNDQSILQYIDAAGTKTAVQKAKQIMSAYKASGTPRTIPGLSSVSGSNDFGCLYFMTPAAFERLNLDWNKCQAFKYSYKTYNSVFFNYYIKKS